MKLATLLVALLLTPSTLSAQGYGGGYGGDYTEGRSWHPKRGAPYYEYDGSPYSRYRNRSRDRREYNSQRGYPEWDRRGSQNYRRYQQGNPPVLGE